MKIQASYQNLHKKFCLQDTGIILLVTQWKIIQILQVVHTFPNQIEHNASIVTERIDNYKHVVVIIGEAMLHTQHQESFDWPT